MGEGSDEIQDDFRADNDLSQHFSKICLSSPKRSQQTDYFNLKNRAVWVVLTVA